MTFESPIIAGDLATIRGQLPAARSIGYLNAGSFGPLPQVAIDAVDAQRTYDAQQRQAVDHWDRLTSAQGAARAALASLTGVASEQLALMHTTHEGLNVCLWGLGLRDGDSVVTTDEEHPGLLVPLRHVRDRLGCEVRTATWGGDDQAFVDGVLEQVDARTRAVVVSHVSWLSGRVAPMRMLRDALPADTKLVVDGAQSAGTLVVTPGDGWDAYTVSGQKWPCGPSGSGAVALVDPEAWQPTYGAFMQVVDHVNVLASPLVGDCRRFEMSQEDLAPLVGIAASVEWLMATVGLDRIHAHARACNARARARLVGGGIDPDSMQGDANLLAIRLTGAVDVNRRLHAAGYLVRDIGDQLLRVSFGCWNTPEEVDGVVDALLDAVSS